MYLEDYGWAFSSVSQPHIINSLNDLPDGPIHSFFGYALSYQNKKILLVLHDINTRGNYIIAKLHTPAGYTILGSFCRNNLCREAIKKIFEDYKDKLPCI